VIYSSLATSWTDAKLVSSINETFSCMSVSNPIPDFVKIYANIDSLYLHYYVEYKCGAVPKDFTMAIIILLSYWPLLDLLRLSLDRKRAQITCNKMRMDLSFLEEITKEISHI